MHIQEMTKKMSEMLGDYKGSEPINIVAIASSDFNYTFDITGGSNYKERALANVLKLFLDNKNAFALFDLSYRELDFFLRDDPSVSSLDKKDGNTLNSLVLKYSEALLTCLVNNKSVKHSLNKKYLKYELAIKTFCLMGGLTHNTAELVELDNELVVISITDAVDKPSQFLEQVCTYLAQLFQDDEINVIPE